MFLCSLKHCISFYFLFCIIDVLYINEYHKHLISPDFFQQLTLHHHSSCLVCNICKPQFYELIFLSHAFSGVFHGDAQLQCESMVIFIKTLFSGALLCLVYVTNFPLFFHLLNFLLVVSQQCANFYWNGNTIILWGLNCC